MEDLLSCMLNIAKEITNDDNDTNLTVAELTNLDDSLNNKEVLNSSLEIVGISPLKKRA